MPGPIPGPGFAAAVVNEPAVTADLTGKDLQGNTLVKVLLEYATAMSQGDQAAMSRACTKDTNKERGVFLAQAGEQGMPMMKAMGAEMVKGVGAIYRIVVRGDQAVAIYGDESDDSKQWFTVVREDGAWKVK